MLEAADDEDAALAADAIDLESSLQYAEASPVVALVDRILLQAVWRGPLTSTLNRSKRVSGCVIDRTACSSSTWSRSPAG